MELTLATPVQFVPRVGPVMAKRLEKLGIKTVEDFLWYAPFRYDDFSLISPINRVQAGETVTINGTVERITNTYTKTGKKLQQARITDASGGIDVIWFNQPFLVRVIHTGDSIHLSGTIDWFGNKLVMQSPQYEIVTDNQQTSLHTGRLVPVYSETEGVSSKWLRGRIDFLLKQCTDKLFEYIFPPIRNEYRLMEIQKSIEYIHFPIDKKSATEARRRLAFDELLIMQLSAYEQKRLRQETQQSYPLTISQKTLADMKKKLPFALTEDQKTALEEIRKDLAKTIPMNRLLVGDVGSGKTVVAAIAMYIAYKNGLRSILMAPTQILAEQHFTTVKKLLRHADIEVGLVTGNKKIKDTPILIGTHALLSEVVPDVALVVIDEQQRFGVKQRTQLTKGNGEKTPHLLTMSATPIPRTIARTMYGNIDLSVLETLPAGRQNIKTWVVPNQKREKAYAWIRQKLNETRGQAFIICPLIEESETMQTVKAVKTEFAFLKKIFSGFTLGLLHGQLPPQEKTEVLKKFSGHSIHILVATPVVEVGIDVPNAMIMMIEGVERFGLSQLHQLRGRVGRGVLASYCLLFTESDDPAVLSRIKTLETTHSGPRLAEVDLRLRGPGELFGTRQHGASGFKIATLSDTALISQAQEAAHRITALSKDLSQFPQLREKVKNCIMEQLLD